MTSYTGPVRPSKEQWEIWYHRMKDVAHACYQRGYGLICHPSDEPMMKDMLDRLKEDETWPHRFSTPPVPVLITSKDMKPGDIRPVDYETAKLKTMADVVRSRMGFGRYTGLATPVGGQPLNNPWQVPDKLSQQELEAALLVQRKLAGQELDDDV